MKTLILLVAISVGHGVLGSRKGGLRVKFDIGLNIGSSFFFDIPRTVPEANEQGWVQAIRPKGPMAELSLYCPPDHVLCTLYDDTNYIAGIQIGIPQEDFTDAVFNLEDQGFTTWTTYVDGVPKKFWTTQQFFTSEESLQKSQEERIAARNPDKTLQEDAVWVTGVHGELVKISTNTQDIVENSAFTKQGCVPWMGRHYYYNMSESTECTAEGILPWFPLVDSDELIGMGFITLGKIAVKERAKNWFEDPSTGVFKLIIPHGPQCLYDLVKSSGAVTMHIYYIDRPWLITCLFS